MLCSSKGLSPRVRGNLAGRASLRILNRSIPACAGEPLSIWPSFSCATVYPRVCGGTTGEPHHDPPDRGLSPRVRGNLFIISASVNMEWSIPACAGEPASKATSYYLSSVYPRVCGGTRLRRLCSIVAHGLSPRVRGNPRRRVARRACRGSIPACAGEPPIHCRPMPSATVYPRVCGGTQIFRPAHVPKTGLSPRVRGNRPA